MAKQRASLASFAPPIRQPMADGAKVVSGAVEPAGQSTRAKYPSVTVYLRPEEIRSLKLISIETNEKLSDLCAVAVREWLERNGHARTGALASSTV